MLGPLGSNGGRAGRGDSSKVEGAGVGFALPGNAGALAELDIRRRRPAIDAAPAMKPFGASSSKLPLLLLRLLRLLKLPNMVWTTF